MSGFLYTTFPVSKMHFFFLHIEYIHRVAGEQMLSVKGILLFLRPAPGDGDTAPKREVFLTIQLKPHFLNLPLTASFLTPPSAPQTKP